MDFAELALPRSVPSLSLFKVFAMFQRFGLNKHILKRIEIHTALTDCVLCARFTACALCVQ